MRFIFRFWFHADLLRRRFEKNSARPVARFQLTHSHARSSRHRGTLYQSQFVKKRSRRLFFDPGLEIAMEDALQEIDEILEQKEINDQHKAMILGENAKRFYNL